MTINGIDQIQLFLPFALGGSIEEVMLYGHGTDRAKHLLKDYSDSLFKSKDTDGDLHAQTVIGAKVAMQTGRRDAFRKVIVGLDHYPVVPFLQAMYDFLQKASHGTVSYDQFKKVEDSLPVLEDQISEDVRA